jgi:hypothetical protein
MTVVVVIVAVMNVVMVMIGHDEGGLLPFAITSTPVGQVLLPDG